MKIETSCGKTFEMSAREMSTWQIQGLLEQNGDRTYVNPAELQELREELSRRANVEPPRP
jgi:hypothetical protein